MNLPSEPELPNLADRTSIAYDDYHDGPREIKHLVLVIHGFLYTYFNFSIGQKLGESIESHNFADDVNTLRTILKAASKDIVDNVPPSICNHIPLNGGIQVLPVLWRHFLNIPLSRSNDPLNDVDQNFLDDIVLDGIPGIRALVSDVIFDGKSIFIDFSFVILDTEISTGNDLSSY
jgi:hypothetical protein